MLLPITDVSWAGTRASILTEMAALGSSKRDSWSLHQQGLRSSHKCKVNLCVCVSSHHLSKTKRWESEAQRLSDLLKTIKILSAEVFSHSESAERLVFSSGPQSWAIGFRCPLHWTEAVAAANLNVSVLHRRPQTPLIIQTENIYINSLSLHPFSLSLPPGKPSKHTRI